MPSKNHSMTLPMAPVEKGKCAKCEQAPFGNQRTLASRLELLFLSAFLG
jgi:hypothetical protein